MNEPHSWFRENYERRPNDLEALSLFNKSKVTAYRCTLLDRECAYVPNTGAGDCRRCNFALAFLDAHPEYVKEHIVARK